MSDRLTLEVASRGADKRGSRNVRRLRAEGLIPGVLYGKDKGSHAFAVGERELRAALTGPSGLHVLIDVMLDGAKHSAIVKDFQRHPVRGTVTHIDLHEVRLDQPIQTVVSLALIGEAPGVKVGGTVTLVLREVHVEALPTAVPEHIDVSVDGLELDDTLKVSDIVAPAGVTILDDPELTIASCAAARTLSVESEADEAASEVAAEDDEPAEQSADDE